MAYNANNDMITNTSLTYQNGTYVNSRLNEFAYNAYHQVTLERHKTWNAVTLQFEFILGDNEIRNYYELFTNDVKTVTSANNTLKVYPMPAGEFLHVQLNSNGNAASLYLFDNTGKMVKQVSTVAGSVINTIDMRDLPAGSYFLKAVSSGNTVTKQVTIVQ